MNDNNQDIAKEGEQITDGERIAVILGRLRREAAPLTIYAPGIESEGKTFILEVDREAGLFSMDRILPLEVQRAFAKAGQLQATAFLRSGARVMFLCRAVAFSRRCARCGYCLPDSRQDPLSSASRILPCSITPRP